MDTRHTSRPPLQAGPRPPVSRAKLVNGLAVFLVLTAGGLAALWRFTGGSDVREVLAMVSGGFLALAALAAVADIIIGAVRYQIFLRRIRPGSSLWLPIRADLANRFVGAVTPSQTGGGPAQVYVLWRGGIPVPDALSFLLVNFLSTLVFFLISGGVAAWMFRERFPEGGISLLVRYGFVAFAACLVVMLVGLLRPEWLARPMAGLAARLEGRPGAAARWTRRCALALSEGVEQYRAACALFVRRNPALPVASFALTVILYLNKFTLGWLVMRGLGVEGDYATTLAVQALLHFVLFVAPSPGGSGIAELGTGALMSLLMPAPLLAPFAVAQRFLLLYLPAAVGAVVLVREAAPPQDRPARACAARRVEVAGAALALALVAGALPAAAASLQALGGDVKTMVVRGLLAADEGTAERSFREAVVLAREGVVGAPADPEAHYLLAVALGYHLEHQGLRRRFVMAAEVRREAERALELDPMHPGAHHVLGRLHAGAMRLNRVARVVLREVLGASVLDGASWKQAEAHFRQAWRSEPGSPRHAMELGALYLDTGRPQEARAMLTEAARLRPREATDSLAAVRARALLVGLGPE